MSMFVTEDSEVPKTPFYVVARDTFMSGWGMSKGRDNWVVLPCQSDEEATIVLENARRRTDMVEAHITESLADLLRRPDITVSLFDREDADRWYTPGGFTWEKNDG